MRMLSTQKCGGVRMEWRLSSQQKRKYEAAERLGMVSRLLENGWPGLTAKETGRIGAALRHSLRNENQQE